MIIIICFAKINLVPARESIMVMCVCVPITIVQHFVLSRTEAKHGVGCSKSV